MVSSDVNNDEAVDLLIGAPFAPAGGEQRGFIGTFYSKKGYQGTWTMVDMTLIKLAESLTWNTL